MSQPISGDILRAKEAIGMIDQVDLSVPIEIPQVPSETEPDNVPAGEHRWLPFTRSRSIANSRTKRGFRSSGC
jgi:hypothetical protein